MSEIWFAISILVGLNGVKRCVMKKRFCIFLMAVAGFFAVEKTAPGAEAPTPRLGMNLNGPADWNTELPFVDVSRLSRQWVSQQKGQPWGKGPALALDANGYVTRLEPDCFAETIMCTISKGHYPSGDYTLLYDGDGQFDFNNGTVVTREPGRIVFKVDASKGAFYVRLKSVNPANYPRNLRVIMPGFEKNYREQIFHPVFLKRWEGVACLRFMDWMETNGSKQQHWEDRPKVEDATWTRAGIPVEIMVELCNRLQCDAWFCMPHLADDGYVREFARVVKARLHPKGRVYVEYSNELWNGMFAQSRWAGEEGRKLGFAEKNWEAGWRFTAYRSVQIFKIWEEVFGGRERLVRVLASQAANSYISERIVEWQDAYKNADALAIAPYITCNVPKEGKLLNEATVAGWTVDNLMDFLETNSLPQSIRWIQNNKKVADKYGLKLIAYEAGQHLVGVGGVENNNAITQLFHAANRHPRMGNVYDKYYQAWAREGGDLLCYFSSVGSWSKWGSWGILEYFDDDPAKSPKFTSTMRWAKSLGQKVNAP